MKCLLFLFLPLFLAAQHPYFPPGDPLVQQQLAEWKDLKFGLLMHWGPYSQWGVVESWSLCPEDEGWCQRRGPYADDWSAYRLAYENLQSTFDPTHFDPAKWAAAAQSAGMRYVVFTTKHHDGFCMFDTKQTDYKITDPKCPFSQNARADVTKAIFDAFRQKGLKVGAYFSKPDWHSDDFWWRYFPPKDRNASYDPAKYPERWKRFQDFTFKQIEELCSNYGRLDLLWLDGAWVRPASTIDRKESWQRNIPDGQDIDLPRIARMARQKQPGILVVDRWIPGDYENYLTPEQGVPAAPLEGPWEVCQTMGDSWSFIPKEHYKSARELVQTLCQVVAKGGNFLLNIAPGPDGEWHPEAYVRLKEIGAWMAVNSEAIYGTTTPANGVFQSENVVFTQKGQGVAYAFYLPKEGEEAPPAKIRFTGFSPPKGSKIKLLGYGKNIEWKQTGDQVALQIPPAVRQKPPCKYAWVFKMEINP